VTYDDSDVPKPTDGDGMHDVVRTRTDTYDVVRDRATWYVTGGVSRLRRTVVNTHRAPVYATGVSNDLHTDAFMRFCRSRR
jgi:hypothetical protein